MPKITGKENLNSQKTIETLNSLTPKSISNNLLKIKQIFSVNSNDSEGKILKEILNKIKDIKTLESFYHNCCSIAKGEQYKNIKCPQFSNNPDDFTKFYTQTMIFLKKLKGPFPKSPYSKMIKDIETKAYKYGNTALMNKQFTEYLIRILDLYLKNSSGKRAIPLTKIYKELKKVLILNTSLMMDNTVLAHNEKGETTTSSSKRGMTDKNMMYIPICDPKTTGIPKNHFENCINAKKIIIDVDNITIYENAFENCVRLKKIVGKGSVKDVKNDAFKGCINLESITVKGFYDEKGELKYPEAFKESKKLPYNIKK